MMSKPESSSRIGFSGALALALVLSACSSSDDEKSPPRPSDEAASSARAACEFKAGALPRDTLGASDRVGKDIPVEHVILLMMENRSFDHYFSQLPAYGQPDVKVADATFSNLDATGAPVAWHKESAYCVQDPAHGWNSVHEQYNAGKVDGFVLTNEPGGARAMGYFDSSDLPFYYELANTVAISDSYFSSLLGPTWPNRMYFYGGSSHGHVENTLAATPVASLFSELVDAGVEWLDYRSNLAPPAMYVTTWLESTKGCGKDDPELRCRVRDISELVPDIAAGKLPPVTFVDPEYSTGIDETSEHPPGNMQLGQEFVYKVVDALTKSPLWKKTVLFITYDEHGGFADHVAPPAACDPGTGAPADGAKLGSFDRLGFRVPVFVVSPYAKQRYVSHVTHDHTSILRFVQARFGLRALSNRDANADAMMDFFDFDDPPFAEPPSFAAPTIDPVKAEACRAAFPAGG